MTKRMSSSVRVQGVVGACQVVAEAKSSRWLARLGAWMGAALVGCSLVPTLAQAENRRTEVDPPPAPPSVLLSVSDAAMPEGNGGSSLMHFWVTVSQASSQPITVAYRVVDCNATCGNHDYQPSSGILTIPANETIGEIAIPVYGDEEFETNENFWVLLSDPTNALISKAVATGTILNDDRRGGAGGPRRLPDMTEAEPRVLPVDPPVGGQSTALSVDNSAVREGDAGVSYLKFKVNAQPVSTVPISVTWRIVDATAHCSDKDYEAASGVLTIPANVASGEIAVAVDGDQNFESDETFTLMLSDAVNAQLVEDSAVGTILNDDRNGGSGGPRRMPDGFSLACANPVHGQPVFRFALGKASHVSLELYDLAGRMIGAPVEGYFQAGTHLQSWNQAKPAPGVYLARFRSDDQTSTQRVTWLD